MRRASSCIAGTAFFVYSYGISRTYDPPNVFSSATLISAALIGCCVGFLPHNYHPARLFMGDSGALLLGLLLAAATISTTGNVTPAQVSTNPVAATLLPLVVPAAIILLPLVDILLAVVRRTARGERPWQPDKQHLHHRMLQIGHGHRRAVLLLWLWAAVAALGSVSFIFVDDARVAGAGVLAAVVVTGVLTIWLPRWSVPGHRPRSTLTLTRGPRQLQRAAGRSPGVAARPARTAGHSSPQDAEHHRVAEAAVRAPGVPAQHALAGRAELGDGGLGPLVHRVGLDLDPPEAAVERVPEQQQLALGVDLGAPPPRAVHGPAEVDALVHEVDVAERRGAHHRARLAEAARSGEPHRVCRAAGTRAPRCSRRCRPASPRGPSGAVA